MTALALLRRSTLRSAAVWALWPLTGCDGCRGDKPYTPFGVTSALPRADSSAPPAPAASAAPLAPELGVKKAVLAPRGARRFSVEGREIEAPASRVFDQAIALAAADGARPIAAWTLADPAAAPAPAPGELWLYPAAGEPRKILDFPAFLPTGESCRHAATLAAPSAALLSLELGATCDAPLVARSPTRALAIVDPNASRPLRFGLRAADPAPGEQLRLELGTRDEDADGRDDFRLTAELSVSGAAPIAAHLTWLDRAAGTSRDAREPGRGLADLLGKELPRAHKKKSAGGSLERVNLARRLLAALCAEGATARVFDWEGAPLRCGSLAGVIDRSAAVEVAAHLALSDVVSALGVLARDGWYFGALSAKQKKDLIREVEKKLTAVPAARIALGARPRAGRAVALSPLAFEPSGALLIETDSGLFRLEAGGAREEPIALDAGIEPWSLEVPLEPGASILGVSYSCDRSELGLLASNGAVPVSALLAPRPGVCGGRRFDDAFRPAPIATGAGLRLLVGGAPLTIGQAPAAAPPRGSARSPDGALLAVPTELGLLIEGPAHELWKIDGWELASAGGCTVANGGERAACVRAGRAELYLKSSP